MNAQAWLSVGRDLPGTHSVAGDIDRMRDKLLNDALLWIAAVSVPALSLSISRMVTLGWRPLFLGQVAMVVMIWGIWLLRHRLPYALRISALLVTLAVVGISGYMQLGILAQSGQFLLLFMFLTALFLNGAAALRVGAVIAAVLVVVAWGVVDGVLETHIDYSTFGQDPRNWLLAIYVVIFYGGAVAFLGWRMRQELVDRQFALEKANGELLQRSREIEAANRIKGEILSNLSHEFRTPLNGILGMTDILRDGEEDAERLSWLAQLHESAESLQVMLNRMIDFASLESEGAQLRHSEFALREIVEAPLRKARALAAQKGLAVSVSFDPGVPEAVITDGRRIQQLLGELLGNAISFTERGSISLDVSIAPLPVEPDRIWIRFDIEDTGCGIAPEEQQRIFQAFHQADGSVTRTVGGNGLGLAISRRIAQLLGGSIGLVSSPAGSVFAVTIPVKIHAVM
jgi:signal transduction histidine kinase